MVFQTTAKKPVAKGKPKPSLKKSKTTARKKVKDTAAGSKTPRKAKKTVSFTTNTCRRSLCFSDEEEVDRDVALTGRLKRDAAIVAEGFYKEKPINSKISKD